MSVESVVKADLALLVKAIDAESLDPRRSPVYSSQDEKRMLYARYGWRRDRDTTHKMAMFQLLFDAGIQPECNIITHCFAFNDSAVIVAQYIDWFCQHGERIGNYHLANSFAKFGIELFPQLVSGIKASGIPEHCIYTTLAMFVRSKKPMSDIRAAFQWFRSQNMPIKCQIFNDVCKTGDYEFCRWLVKDFGLKLEMCNLNFLLFHSSDLIPVFDHDLPAGFDLKPLKIQFVKQCILLVLAHTSLEIPESNIWQCYHIRSEYAFEGRIYDWMCATQPIMQAKLNAPGSRFQKPEPIN